MTSPPVERGRPVLADLDALFKAFADPTRLRVLNVLAAGELCVCDVVEILAIPQPTVSRNLGILRAAGLVDVTREWKFAHYRLAQPGDSATRKLIRCMRSSFRDVESLEHERAQADERVRARETDPC